MQGDFERESVGLQDLETQKQNAHSRLEEMEQQRAKLEGMLNDVKQKCQEESQMISSLQTQIRSQESDMRSQEDSMSQTKAELNRLQDEETRLEQNLMSGRVQLDGIVKSMNTTHDELNQARTKLSMIQENQKEVSKTIEQYNSALKELNGGNYKDFEDVSDGFAEKENRGFVSVNSSLKSRIAMFNTSGGSSSSSSPLKDPPPDPFQTEDPFKSTLLDDPFGGDPFKESYSFRGAASEDFFKRSNKSDPFAFADPFGRKPTPPAKPGSFSSSDSFTSNSSRAKDSDVFGTMDPFAGNAFGSKGGFADFSQMPKKSENPAVAKKSVRPAPPYVRK
ncbi:epidermal growth factor receptor substrate 15-like 1 isoform X2 [Eucyclogobius newberryi]|uniref:epidermal growth factor receptor substrate 15-like 1 isoform X2 n=1 Tax=Eucyclogobius newberryi TaxID=166745 RepID=UPI003B598A28